MTMSQSNLHYWQYYIALERDLAKTTRYVEIADANMHTYSIEFARIILCAGSEIDVLFKVLAERHTLTIKPKNIDGYRKKIPTRFSGFAKLEVTLARYERILKPWSNWETNTNPSWWKVYNDIKHERNLLYPSATLEAALGSMAGLFVLLCYVCQQELSSHQVHPWPELLGLNIPLNARIRADLRPGYTLPDFLIS